MLRAVILRLEPVDAHDLEFAIELRLVDGRYLAPEIGIRRQLEGIEESVAVVRVIALARTFISISSLRCGVGIVEFIDQAVCQLYRQVADLLHQALMIRSDWCSISQISA